MNNEEVDPIYYNLDPVREDCESIVALQSSLSLAAVQMPASIQPEPVI